MMEMELKTPAECLACGTVTRSIELSRVVRAGDGWVNYMCPNCQHVMSHLKVEKNEKSE